MTRSISAIIIAVAVVSASNDSLAQWYDRIQTESDWEAGFRDGYFDYNSYQLYRELVEGETITDTSEYVMSALGNTAVEVTSRSIYSGADREDFRNTGTRPPEMPVPPFDFRMGRKIDENGDEGYLSLERLSPGFETRLKLRDEDDRWRADRRSFDISDERLRIRIGSYSPLVACGLGIGRFDYRPVSYEPDQNPDRGFLFPDNSYYNGILIAYRTGHKLFYSVKKYNDVIKNFVGGSTSIALADYRLGITASSSILSSDSGRRTMGTGTVFLVNEEEGLRSEVGYGQSGAGFCGQVHRAEFDVRFWHYDESFINLQSSAPAHPDYESFTDPGLELAFRQPQQGETGLFVKRRSSLGRLDVQGALETWKRSPDRSIAMENSLRARVRFYGNLFVYSFFSERLGAATNRTLIEFGSSHAARSEYGIMASLRVDEGKIDKKRSRYFIHFSVPVKRNFFVGGRFRWNAEGEFDYFIEEKTSISGYFSIKATYRWKESYGNDLGPLYMIVESLR